MNTLPKLSDNAARMQMDPPSRTLRPVSGPSSMTKDERKRSLERDLQSPGTQGAR